MSDFNTCTRPILGPQLPFPLYESCFDASVLLKGANKYKKQRGGGEGKVKGHIFVMKKLVGMGVGRALNQVFTLVF